MAELTQGFSFDLADALAGNFEFPSHFLQGALVAVIQAETQAQHLFLAGRQGVEHLPKLLPHQGV